MPRKGKQSAGEGSNTFKLDTRPVKATATAPSDEVARQTLELDKAVRTAMIGFGTFNVLRIANKLKFGTYNDRPQKSTEVNKMITSFEMNGRQWFKEENALAIVINPGRVRNLEELKGEWDDPESLTEVKFMDDDALVMASGQHRVAALLKMAEGYLSEQTALEKKIVRLEDRSKLTDEDVEEHDALRKRLSVVKGELESLGTWSVKLYDQDVINTEKLGGHLSHNQTLHVYGETQEEKLVSKLRDLKEVVSGEGGMDAFLKALQVETERGNNTHNSKLRKVWKNPDLVLAIMDCVLILGPHYRHRRELTVNWLANNMDVVMGMYRKYLQTHGEKLWHWASPDTTTTPTLEEARELVKDAKTSPDAHQKLLKAYKHITTSDQGSPTIFAPFLEEVNAVAVKHFDTYEGVFGTRDEDYITALASYRAGVIKTLKQGLMGIAVTSNDKKFVDCVLARIYISLTPIESLPVPMPIMTGMVMDRVWKELESAKEGYTEVARWFEALLDTMKTVIPHTHAVDDHTEALFHAIERERDIDTEATFNEVWQVLFDARTTSVLRLHNTMSSIDIQRDMATRPTSKDALTKRWDGQAITLKNQARKMVEDLRKFLGKGDINLPPLIANKPGMHAVVVTGWDWRKVGTGKHVAREVEPLLHAILMEQQFATSYRKKILMDPVIWMLRAKLRHEMSCRSFQTKLVVETEGNTELEKSWSYWDDIEVPKPMVDVDMEDEEQLRRTQISTSHRIAAEKADRDAITKVVKQITSLSVARVSTGKKSPLAIEVAEAVNDLVQALTLNASRIRKRVLLDDNVAHFDPATDIVDLGIRPASGELDLNTDYNYKSRASKDAKQAGNTEAKAVEKEVDQAANMTADQHATSSQSPQVSKDNDSSPSTTSKPRPRPVPRKNDKGKRKASPVASNASQDEQVDEHNTHEPDDGAPIARDTSIASTPPPKIISTDAVNAQNTIGGDIQVVSHDGEADMSMSIDEDDGLSTGAAQLDADPDGSAVLPAKVKMITLQDSSPLSPTSALSSDDQQHVNMPGRMNLVAADELEETLSGKRRSSRPKHQPAPRAAPAPSTSATHASKGRLPSQPPQSASLRSSAVPSEASAASKRSRQDADLRSSPGTKKKQKLTPAQAQSDNDLVTITPGM